MQFQDYKKFNKIYGDYGSYFTYRLYEIFPARSPVEGSAALQEVRSYLSFPGGLGRTAARQAQFQALSVLITFLIAAVGGAITGTYEI